MKNFKLLFVAIFLLIAGTSWGQLKASPENRPIFQVGGKNFTRGQVDTIFGMMLGSYQAQGVDVSKIPQEKLEAAKLGVVKQMIMEELLTQEIEKQKIKVSKKEINKAFKEMKKQRLVMLQRLLAQNGVKKNLKKKAEQELANQMKKSGVTTADLKKEAAQQLKLQKLLEKAVPMPSKPSEKELKKVYAQMKKAKTLPINDSVYGAFIFLNIKKGESADVVNAKKTMLNGWAAEVLTGKTPFSILAAKNSDDTTARQTGGAVKKPFLASKYGKDFAGAIKGLAVGKVSRVFKTGSKLGVFMMLAKNDGKYESYEAMLMNEYLKKADASYKAKLNKYIETLVKKHGVVFFDESVKPADGLNANDLKGAK